MVTGADSERPAGVPDGRRRVVLAAVRPSIEHGRWPIKRIIGDRLVVEADLLVDGHDHLAGVVRYRPGPEGPFIERPLAPRGNDVWSATLELLGLGRWQYSVVAWLDEWATFVWGLGRKVDAGQDVGVELLGGAALLSSAATRAQQGRDEAAPGSEELAADLRALLSAAERLADDRVPVEERARLARDPALAARVARHPDRRFAVEGPLLEVVVDPPRARFSSWYELFPRSTGAPGVHGTFADVERRLDYVANLGFDVLYLPPIHPIGRTHRKGPNNTLTAGADDVGSPWAIGDATGGHKAVHPQLGTLDDLRRLVQRARARGIEVALDIAFQASPDHPYVRQHPEWFVHRADGTIQYAENPPKQYQDVYPFRFDGETWRPLWEELRSVFEFWVEQGVTIFRVDNPHTKPLPFWAWCIETLKREHPELIFLAEAFTRPKLMAQLAKIGFSQSYTYFTWRTTKWELTEYLRQLTESELREYFRPNFWPNTPDILPEQLQWGGRPAFLQRLILAATLSSNFGLYGPPFELMESTPRPGAEEYLDNEKYQLRHWALDRPDSLAPLIARLNHIRRQERALQDNVGLYFHPTDNDLVLCYSKRNGGEDGAVLVVVNLDPRHTQTAFLDIHPEPLGVRPDETFQVHDLLGDSRWRWRPGRNFVRLDPQVMPAHLFRVRRHVATEHEFEYYI